MKSALWSIVKYVLAVVLLVVILRHAQTDKILGYLRQIPPYKLLLAFLLISSAQIVSAFRMRYFFRAAGHHLSPRFAIILFYVGAFYNFLLPGGIGGDAYKVILVRKRMNVLAKDGIRIMLADRASGLCILMFALFGGLFALPLEASLPYADLLPGMGLIATLAGYLLCSHWLLKRSPRVMLTSLLYSVAGQGLWMGGVLTVWSALGNGHYALEYILLYCAASITGMLPVSVGGLGIKEMTYYYGAHGFKHYAHSGVDGDLGIAISLCLFFLMFAASLPGMLWLNRVEKADVSHPSPLT